MNVGQVEFSVTSKTLESVLASAKELQGILNGMDGRTFGTGSASGTKKAARDVRDYHNKVRRETANEEKRYAIRQRGERLKEQKQLYTAQAKMAQRYRLQTKKDQAAIVKDKQNAEARYAAWKHNNDKKIAAAELKEQERARKVEQQQRKESYLAASRMAFREREQQKKAADDARKAEQASLLQTQKERAEFQKGVQTQLVNAGAQMQTLGSTIQRVTSPFTDVYRGLIYGVGYRLLGKVTESISGAFSRYDTIKTYAKVLGNLGINATKKFSIAGQEATDVYHNLENSVLGLPTGIDEIIESMRRYAGATGEAERATKLAIAANNAYIAGHMGEREKLFTERQLVALAGGAELSTNQWDSLRRNAPLAMKVVSKEMKMSVQEMIDSLKKGKISGQEFLDVFIKAGTEGKIKNAAQVMKQTWDAVAQNVQNRLNAMGEGILKSLNSVFKTIDGRNFLQHALGVDKNGDYIKGRGIRGFIDDMAKSAQSWIKAHPDRIIDFFDRLKSINWKSIIGGFAEAGLSLGKFYMGLIKIFGNGGMIKFMVGMNIFGKVLQNVGGIVKGAAWFSSWAITLAKFGKMGAAAKGASDVAKFAVKSKALKKAADTTASMALSWQQVAMRGINILSIGVVAGAVKLIASAFVDIGRADVDFGKLGEFAAGAGGFIAEFLTIAQLIGGKGVATGAAQLARILGELEIGLVALDISAVAKSLNDVANVEMPSRDKLKSVMDSVKDFASVLPSIDIFKAIGKFFSSKAVSSTAKAVSSVTAAINSVNSLKGSLKKFRKAMFGSEDPNRSSAGGAWGDENSIVGIMDDMLHAFDNNDLLKTFAEDWKSSNIAKVFSALASMMTDFTTIATTNLKPKQIEKATENITTLSESISPLLDAFDELYVAEFSSSTGLGKTLSERKGAAAAKNAGSSTFGAQASGFARMMEQLDKTLEYVSSIITRFNKMSGKIKRLQDNYGGEEGLDFTPFSDALGAITGAFEASGVATGDYSLAVDNMSYIDESMGSLSKVINKMIKIKNKIAAGLEGGEEGYINIGDKIGQIVSDLVAACQRVPQLEAGVSMLSNAIGVLKGAMDKLSTLSGTYTAQIANVTSAIDQLAQIGTKTIFIAIAVDGKVTENITSKIFETAQAIDTALKLILPVYERTANVDIKLGFHTDTVTPYISSVATRIWNAFNRIPTSLTKTVTLNIKKQRNEIQMHTGGKVGHKVQYRAHGGSIFKPKGTDTIPAMLTEGEFVVNHMASNAIGYDILQKLNHLDIAGAIRGLYAKAASNTINNTKNANVTVNNYNAPSVGFAKASRWVAQL